MGVRDGCGPGGAHGGAKRSRARRSWYLPDQRYWDEDVCSTIALLLHPNSMMEFWHWYTTEAYWDGG